MPVNVNKGNVRGPDPASSTDNAVVRWDSTTGRLIQDSLMTIDDDGLSAHAVTTDWHSAHTWSDTAGNVVVRLNNQEPSTFTFSSDAAFTVTPAAQNIIGSANTVYANAGANTFTSGDQTGGSASIYGRTFFLGTASSTVSNQTGGSFLSVWGATGTANSMIGFDNGVYAGSTTQVSGNVAQGIGGRTETGFIAGAMAASFTNVISNVVQSPLNTDGTHTITNNTGQQIQDQMKTGITNSWALEIKDQSAGGYAIQTGTGLVEFGDETTIEKTSAEAFLVRQDADAGDVFRVDTTDPALGSIQVVDIQPNGGNALVGSGSQIRPLRVWTTVGSGTQTNFIRGLDSRVTYTGAAIHSGTAGSQLRAFNATLVWNSTGTCSSMVGVQSFIGPGGTGVTGTITEAIGNRSKVGYGAGTISGIITNAYCYTAEQPKDTTANNTITNSYGFNIEDQGDSGVGVTNSWGIFMEDQSDYAIKTGLGFVEFGGRVMGNKGSDIASADEITLGVDGNYFDITGTTTINHINNTDWQAGSVVILQFDASVTVTHNSAAPAGTEASILLAGAANFSATVDDTLTLVYDGVTWRETARTVI